MTHATEGDVVAEAVMQSPVEREVAREEQQARGLATAIFRSILGLILLHRVGYL